MGLAKNQKHEARSKNSRRGSTNNKSRLEAFGRSSATTGGDWGACDPGRIQAVVMGITQLGGAVTFALSRDKGAHSLTLMLDDDRQTLWFNGDAVLDDELLAVIGKLEAMTD